MNRWHASVVVSAVLALPTASCVGPQYDATPDLGDVATDDIGTETESETESDDEAEAEGDVEPCPDVAPREEDAQAARAAFQEGVSAFVGEQWADAALAFCRAYAARPRWQIMYNLAQCYLQLGDADRALAAFERFIADGGDAVPIERREETLAEIERIRASGSAGR